MVWRWFFFGKKEENGENIEVVSIAVLPGSLCSIGARTHYTISTPSIIGCFCTNVFDTPFPITAKIVVAQAVSIGINNPF